MAVVDGPDIQRPVARQQQGAGQKPQQHARPARHLTQPCPLTTPAQHGQQENQRPKNTLQDDVEGIDIMQQLEIQRKQPPEQEAAYGIEHGSLTDSSQKRKPRTQENKLKIRSSI